MLATQFYWLTGATEAPAHMHSVLKRHSIVVSVSLLQDKGFFKLMKPGYGVYTKLASSKNLIITKIRMLM